MVCRNNGDNPAHKVNNYTFRGFRWDKNHHKTPRVIAESETLKIGRKKTNLPSGPNKKEGIQEGALVLTTSIMGK